MPNLEKGTWEPEGEIFIHQALVNRLGLEVKPHYQEDVEYFIKGQSYENVAETPNLIALENGVLDVENLILKEKSPAYFIISKIPETYDKNAKCPAILKFSGEVFGENQLNALQEALGYTLHKEPLFEKAFMLIGDGANGKSTFLNLLQIFLGLGNHSNVTLQEICYNRFASANLYQKMANISADLPKEAISTSGRFKMLTGRDMVSAEFKHKNSFQFQNTAKMWFSCNEFPQTTEDTLAYVRRWKIFNCGNVFIGEKADPKILEKLTTQTELSGFLNWILEGLKRLLMNGRFSANETEETLRANILKFSNPTKAFIEKTLEKSNRPQDYIIEAELYREFIIFCDSENLPSVRKGEFTQALIKEIPDVKQTKQRILGKNTPVYQFIKKFAPSAPPHLFDTAKNPKFLEINKALGAEGADSKKPSFYVKDILPGAKCDCGKFAVTKEILIPSGDTILRCESCFNGLRELFKEANWKQGSPEMPNFEDKEGVPS
jgi:putative DNA primase/helicase